MGAPPQPPRAPTILCAATVCLVAAGCQGMLLPSASALFSSGGDLAAATGPAPQRTAPAAAKTLPVELLFIRHDPHDAALTADLWTLVDEQALGRDCAARLAANGLRAGILSGELPPAVADRLALAAATANATEADAVVSRRILRLLPGKRAELVAVAGIPEMVVLEHDTAGVRGGTYRDCTAQLAARAWPGPDGRTRIELVPELKHGPPQRTWIGEEGMFRLEAGQPRKRFEQLTIEALLPHRGMLVIGGADAASSTVGDALVRERSAGTAGMQLIVLRPLGTGVDPVFATAIAADPAGPAPSDAAHRLPVTE